jgi:hypothetical protein
MPSGIQKTSRPPVQYGTKRDLVFKKLFIEKLAQGMSVTRAAEESDLGRATVFSWRREDPAFAAAWDDANAQGVDRLEDEARRRARDGYNERTVVGRDGTVSTIRDYSDQLMLALLRAKRPQEYVQQTGAPAVVSVTVKTQTEAVQHILSLGLPPPIDLDDSDYEEEDAGPDNRSRDTP